MPRAGHCQAALASPLLDGKADIAIHGRHVHFGNIRVGLLAGCPLPPPESGRQSGPPDVRQSVRSGFRIARVKMGHALLPHGDKGA